jgi:glycosyltransferase involved in cell wall biosynthesis
MSQGRLLVISHLYPNTGFPYEGTYVFDMLPYLQKDWDVHVLVPRDLLPTSLYWAGSSGKGIMGRLRQLAGAHRLTPPECDARIHYCPFVRPLGMSGDYRFWERWLAPQIARRAVQLGRKYPLDVILCFGLMPDGAMGLRAGRALGVPVINYSIGSDLHSIKPGRANHEKITDILRSSDLVMTVSGDLRDRAVHLLPDANVKVLPIGVDTAYYTPQAVDLGPGRHIAFMSVFKPVKDPMLAFQAFQKLARDHDDVTLHVTCDGPMLDQAKAFVREHGLETRIKFYGIVPRAEVLRIMRGADVVMLTSKREGSPRVLLEAGAVGVPVVSTGVGGVPELVADDQTGYLVPAGDADALVEKLTLALARKWDRDALRAHAEQFGWPAFAAKISQNFKSVMQARTPQEVPA